MPAPTPGETLIADLTTPGTSVVAHLAKAVSFDQDDLVTLAGFTECDFPGYAPIPITNWEDVDPNDPDIAQVVSAVLHFESGEAISGSQQALCLYLTATKDGVGTIFMAMEWFEIPYVFNYPGDALERQVRMSETLAQGPSLVE